VTQPQAWPFEQPAEGTLRPWYLTATGYLEALFSDPEEAQRAQRGLLQRKIPREELRLYESEEILRIMSQLQEERSIVAKAVAALVADQATLLGQRLDGRRRPLGGCPDQGPRRPPGPAAGRLRLFVLALLRRPWRDRRPAGSRPTPIACWARDCLSRGTFVAESFVLRPCHSLPSRRPQPVSAISVHNHRSPRVVRQSVRGSSTRLRPSPPRATTSGDLIRVASCDRPCRGSFPR